MTLTLASLLEVAGIAAAAALTTGIVALLKSVFPPLNAKVSGALMAFVITLVLYLLAGFSTGAGSLEAWFAVFVAWLTCATAAVGVYSTVNHVAETRTP